MNPPEDELDEALAGARPDEPVGTRLAQARIAQQLFGTTTGFGRFRVLDRLGSGGMGVVYAAYDPQLDRGVALKMVEVREGERDAALTEAKALAKLSHPNVVPVYDVGIAEGHVYIVMELVRGETLGAHATGRTQREVLDVYRQAGAALAAAHAAGLVHRDFKPDNAIVGGDGRVRVVDFGLARDANARARAGGTPRYMAPEQAVDAAVTPAADQYSFCVALAEALGPDPPRRLVAILERGRAKDPAARFESMDQLLAALGRDPARRRIAIATVTLAAVAFAYAIRPGGSEELEICGGGEAEVANAWPGRAEAVARLADLGAYGRELAPRIERTLAEHATRWAVGHRGACLDHRRGLLSDPLFDRRMECLQRGLAALGEVRTIVATATPETLPDIALAIAAVPEPAACADRSSLASNVEPPPLALAPKIATLRDELERARVLLAAGRIDAARALTRPSVAAARALAYPPVLGEALLLDGRVAMPSDDRAGAVAILREATSVGFTARVEAVAIEAWARRAWLEGTSGEPPAAAVGGVEVIEAIAARPQTPAFARALLHANLGGIELARGDRAAAAAMLDRAVAESAPVRGADAIELLSTRMQLVIASDDPVASDAVLVDIIATLSTLLGDQHPLTLDAGFIRATTTMASKPAAAELLATIGERSAIHRSLTAQTAECWAEVADLRAELADPTAAIAAAERAATTDAGLAVNYPEVAGYLALWRGDTAGAIRLLEAARAKRTPDAPWYERYTLAKLELALGRAYLASGRGRDARAVLERTVATLATITEDHRAVAITRRLARARAELVRAGSP